MNIDEMIEVLQAYKDGKELEWSCNVDNKDWVTFNGHNVFNFCSFVYRVKPEPRVRYIPVWNNDEDTLYEVAYKTAGDLLRTCDRSALHHYIKMVEVTE